MKIAITGAAGLIGSSIGAALINRGIDVVGIDNLSGGLPENVNVFSRFHKIDCNELDKLYDIFYGVDVLVDCASAAYEGLSVFSPNYVSKNVFQSSVASFTAALGSGTKRILYFSSMARYGAQSAPFTERLQPQPIDPYGVAKVAAESMLACLRKYHDFSYSVIVPHNVYGPRQRYYDPFRNVISLTINRILLGLPPLVFGSGAQKRSFTYIDDIIPVILRLIDSSEDGGIYNVGSPQHQAVSIRSLFTKICAALDYSGPWLEQPARLNEVDDAVCDVGLCEKTFGFNASTTLEIGIERCIGFIQTAGVRQFQYVAPVEIKTDLVPPVWIGAKA
jgi:UDP-glucose 4-epimerase